VHEGASVDFLDIKGELPLGGQVSEDEQEAGLEEGRFAGQLPDRVPSVLDCSPESVELADAAFALEGETAAGVVKFERVALFVFDLCDAFGGERVGMDGGFECDMVGVVGAVVADEQLVVGQQTGVFAGEDAVDLSQAVHADSKRSDPSIIHSELGCKDPNRG
jgi:hypothetical protein